MSNLSSSQLVYSLDGLPLSPMGLTSVSIEQLHRLGIHTLEQLARIALLNSVDRNAICDLLQQELRARLWPAIVHCYILLADQEGEQTQFVIESELFHFVAWMVSSKENTYTCSYESLQIGAEEGVPFHKLKQANASRQPKFISEEGSQSQVMLTTEPPPPAATPSMETIPDSTNASEIERGQIELSASASESTSIQRIDTATSTKLDLPPAIAALAVTYLKLSNRTLHALSRNGIHTFGQLVSKSDEELLKLKNFGVTSLREVRDVLLSLPSEILVESVQTVDEKGSLSDEKGLLISDFPKLFEALSEIKDFPLRFLSLNVRTANALWHAGIYTLGDLFLLRKSSLFEIRNMGVRSVDEIKSILNEIDIEEIQQITNKLRQQGRKPSDLPITCLGLPDVTVYRKLRGYGIEHIENLCNYTVDDLEKRGFKPSDIASVKAMLRIYGLALHGQTPPSSVLQEASPEQITTNTYTETSEQQEAIATQNAVEQQPISVSDSIRMMLSQVQLRQAEVLRLRYGFEDQIACTLEEVGQQIGVTRERVRQIEKKAINQLQRPHCRRPIDPFILLLINALREANGVLSLQSAREILSKQTVGNIPISESQLTFILLFAHQIQLIKDISIIVLDREPYTAYIPVVQNICTILRRNFANALAPLRLAEVLVKFNSDANGKIIRLHIPENFIIACLKAHPDIVVDEDGIYGLKQWANKRLDDIIIVMRQHGKAMHYSEIADRVNQRLPSDQQTKAHNVHAQIGRLPDIFVRVGHGIFGLAEWGLKQDRTLADAAYRVLCEAKHALDIEQLTDRVLEVWYVKRTSVRAAVDLDPRFTIVGQGMYWLAETVSSSTEGKLSNDFDTLFGDVLLRRREELERDRATSSQHDALEDVRRLGTAIFG